jgi:hypothetical protein
MALTYDLRQGGCMETTSDVPVGVSAFIGRERERAEVGDLGMEMRVATFIGLRRLWQDPTGHGGRRGRGITLLRWGLLGGPRRGERT